MKASLITAAQSRRLLLRTMMATRRTAATTTRCWVVEQEPWNPNPSSKQPLPQSTTNTTLLGRIYKRSSCMFQSSSQSQRRSFSFTFAGPKQLKDILNIDTLADQPGTAVADLWYTYHEGKENVAGLVLDGEQGSTVLERATKCPFFVQPVFRDDGYFMLVSQFQKPAHFLLAYLEDYKMDPSAATPLLTFSVFTDYAANKDVALVRCDILNPSIQGTEGRKVVESVLLNYQQDFPGVQTFNERPAHFDFDDYISRMNDRWNKADSSDAAET